MLTIKKLIKFLEAIEDKDQGIGITSYDFETMALISEAVEIKSSTDNIMYPCGVTLVADI